MQADQAVEKPVANDPVVLAQEFFAVPMRAVRPLVRIPRGPNYDHWLVEVDKIAAATSGSSVRVSLANAGKPLLSAFIEVHKLGNLLEDIKAAARSMFGGNGLSFLSALGTDPDVGNDFVRLDIRVPGMTRDAFRKKREEFDAALEALPGAAGFERVVVVPSRIA